VNRARSAAVITIFCAIGAFRAHSASPSGCAAGKAAFQDMVETEYAFATAAQTSVRAAFLEYLADDSLVLQPRPTPARAFYEALKPNNDKLEWYPSVAAMSGGGDLGFTTGPWVYTGADAARLYGHFLTVWKRDSQCRWRAQFDGGISHPKMDDPPVKLVPDQAAWSESAAPAENLVAKNALGKTMHDFQNTAQQDGLSAGVRTYARNSDFRLYVEGMAALSAAAANRLLSGRPAVGTWSEDGHGRSADSALAYSVGRFLYLKKGGNNAYVQIWQYDSKVANWGLRILLITPIPEPNNKS
jgi:ketosteroid isomerase-like protein